MKIAIFVNEDYDFMFDMLKELIPGLKKNHTLAGIIRFPNRLVKYKGISIYFAYLKIFGFLVFGKLTWRSLIKRFSILFDYIFHKCPFYSFKGMYSHYDLTSIFFLSPNHYSAIKWVKDNHIDIILLFVGYILKRDIIEAPKVCILNKHSALLPAYRGVFPVFWTMMNNDRVGVTIHKVNEEIDGGGIVLQKTYQTYKSRSVFDYYKAIFSDTPDLILESLKLVSNNTQKRYKQEISQSYFGLPTRRDYCKFKKLGYKFI